MFTSEQSILLIKSISKPSTIIHSKHNFVLKLAFGLGWRFLGQIAKGPEWRLSPISHAPQINTPPITTSCIIRRKINLKQFSHDVGSASPPSIRRPFLVLFTPPRTSFGQFLFVSREETIPKWNCGGSKLRKHVYRQGCKLR